MHRELCEETAIRPEEISSTTVAGFARWLDRGAKPEFFGLTRLSVTADDLAGRRALAPGERRYSEGTLTARLDLDALGRELENGADLLAAPSLPGQIREDGSLPLLLGLRAVALRRARSVAASQERRGEPGTLREPGRCGGQGRCGEPGTLRRARGTDSAQARG